MKQNERHVKARHPDRCKEVEDVWKNKKTCPEESIYQLGTIDEHASVELLVLVFDEFKKEFDERFGSNVHIIDWSLHMDEATPHIHERHVFDATNQYGEIEPKQEAALKELGFELPNSEKKRSKTNNRKVVFDSACRTMFLDICKRHGLELDEEPSYGGRKYLEKQDYIRMKQKEEIADQKETILLQIDKVNENRLELAKQSSHASKPKKWLAFLDGLLEEDDIVCLQEFMGYCLIPSNRGQKMLLIIGKGGEGKSRIGRILKRIFGHNMNSGSLQKLETDKFARADQEGKLLYLDDDMKTEALPSTNVIKAIVTAEDEMDLEKKNQQSYQGLLVCRILAFGNGTLKSLFDRSKGFYRRQIILETKDVPPDRINDPYLADKMMEEVEGIVLWCIEGLERLIRNDYQFTISNKSQLLMDEMQEDDDNILSFLESTGYIRLEKGTHATSKDLYIAYCRWCNDNLDVPVSERSFARRFKERSSDYGMTYDKNISVGNGRFCRGFRGIHVKVRTKDVNY